MTCSHHVPPPFPLPPLAARELCHQHLQRRGSHEGRQSQEERQAPQGTQGSRQGGLRWDAALWLALRRCCWLRPTSVLLLFLLGAT